MAAERKLLGDYDPNVLNPAFDPSVTDGDHRIVGPMDHMINDDSAHSPPQDPGGIDYYFSERRPPPAFWPNDTFTHPYHSAFKPNHSINTQLSPQPKAGSFRASKATSTLPNENFFTNSLAFAAPAIHTSQPSAGEAADPRLRKKSSFVPSISASTPPVFATIFQPTPGPTSIKASAAASPISSSSKITKPKPKPKPKTTTPWAKITTVNGSTRIAGHAPELDTAPPATARLPPCEMSATELLYLFPNHTQWPKVMLRLLGSGWTVSDMASAALYPRAIVDDKVHERRCAAMRYQTSEAGRAEFGDPTWTQTKAVPGQVSVVTSYDVSTYTPRHKKHLTTIKLLDVARGVQWWPATSDRGIVTQVVRYARDNPIPCADFTTDDIPHVAAQQGFTMPRGASRSDWDALCLHNFRTALDSVKIRMAKGTL
ncbi:hypothetical protein LTR86_008950 [Recurvomyces mirabilis]|nr:hypothetical protein LTR86_008950 [Recurvomyces mirabilis]